MSAPAPRTLNGWVMMDTDRLPTLWADVGSLDFTFGGAERKWIIGRSETTLAIYLMTDLPHPDDPKVKVIYRMNPGDLIKPFAEKLLDGMAV